MKDDNKPRSVKITSHCGKCNEEHNEEGVAAIYAVLTKENPPHFTVSAGLLSVYGGHEFEVMLTSLLQVLWKTNQMAFMAALARFAQNTEGFGFNIENKGPVN